MQNLDRKAAKISALSSNNLNKYEYLTGEDFGLKPSTVDQVKFVYSSLGKILNKELSEDDKKEGLFKRLKNIENAQKALINGNNKPDSARSELSKLSISSIFDSISSKSEDKDEDENKKTECKLYQDGVEAMKGLFHERETKDEKSQMYLENNLNKIKNKFRNIYNKYPRFFQYIANKEKENINYEILSNKVDSINFYDIIHCTVIYLSLI